GGILALPTNIGNRERTDFAIVPEGGINFGYKITPHLSVTAGYSFLLWNHVVRPGRNIDPNVNPTLVPTDLTFGQNAGPARPLPLFNTDIAWVHTPSAGLSFQY